MTDVDFVQIAIGYTIMFTRLRPLGEFLPCLALFGVHIMVVPMHRSARGVGLGGDFYPFH